MNKILFFGDKFEKRAAVISAFIFVTVILFSSTIGEFVIALHNKYQIYPVGTDTNMYGNSGIATLVICLFAALTITRLLYKKLDAKVMVLAIVLFFGMGFIALLMPNFTPDSWCKYELTIYPCEYYEQ